MFHSTGTVAQRIRTVFVSEEWWCVGRYILGEHPLAMASSFFFRLPDVQMITLLWFGFTLKVGHAMVSSQVNPPGRLLVIPSYKDNMGRVFRLQPVFVGGLARVLNRRFLCDTPGVVAEGSGPHTAVVRAQRLP